MSQFKKCKKLGQKISAFALVMTSVASLTFISSPSFAQDDLLDDADDALSATDALDMDQIDIDGKLSPSELMKRRREKLEERNKVMVEKKIEDIRVKQEMALTQKLQGAFSNSLSQLDGAAKQPEVAPTPAPAPAPVQVAPAPIVETKIVEVPAPEIKEIKKSKIIPSVGVSSIKGDRIDLQSNASLGILGESEIYPQVALGLGLTYTTLDLTDVSNNFIDYGYGNYGLGYNAMYGGSGRQMEYTKLQVEAHGKYFFIDEAKLRPYAGIGLSFNRSNLNYQNNNSYYNGGVNFGNESLVSTSMAAKAMLGAEFSFTETLALNIDLSYCQNVTSGISQSAGTNASINPDQRRLENVMRQIDDGSVTQAQIGLAIKF